MGRELFYTSATFIGIDPTAGQKPFSFAALDNELRLLALDQGSMDEVLAFTAGQRQAFVAVCSPQRPNQGLMDRPEVRDQLSPRPRPGRWANFRILEYQLRQHNISCPQTLGDENKCPGWMKKGFLLYRRLESIGYCPYPDEAASLQWMEVYPHASFSSLLEVIPLPKASFEGRIQRQLVLYEKGLHIPDPMRLFEEITRHRLLQGQLPLEDLYTPEEMDALVAAYTAWMAANQPQMLSLLGDPSEGQIVLPVSTLKRRY
jgi:hypothetical protein